MKTLNGKSELHKIENEWSLRVHSSSQFYIKLSFSLHFKFEVQYQNKHFQKKIKLKNVQTIVLSMMMLLYWYIDVFWWRYNCHHTLTRNAFSEWSLQFQFSRLAHSGFFFRSSSLFLLCFFFILCPSPNVLGTFFTAPFTISFHANSQMRWCVLWNFVCSLPLCLKHTARQFLIVS